MNITLFITGGALLLFSLWAASIYSKKTKYDSTAGAMSGALLVGAFASALFALAGLLV